MHSTQIDQDLHGATLKRAHADALDLLSLPELSGHTMQALTNLPPGALPWLWTRDGESAAAKSGVRVFIESLGRLATLPGSVDPVALGTLLGCLGHAWRQLPALVLYRMLESVPRNGVMPRLRALEINHVARWVLARGPESNCDLMSTWSDMVEFSLAWQRDDEILLRQRPNIWSHPFAAVVAAGFELLPICSTDQLASATGHTRPLCHLETASACGAGHVAWWFVKPVYRSGQSEEDADAALGLARDHHGNWTVAGVLATDNGRAAMHSLAICLQVQVQTITQLARGAALAASKHLACDARSMLVEVLKAASGNSAFDPSPLSNKRWEADPDMALQSYEDW